MANMHKKFITEMSPGDRKVYPRLFVYLFISGWLRKRDFKLHITKWMRTAKTLVKEK